jgi:Carboxypeptidase regulatory-like domain/TonB dependent receptor
MKCHAVPVRVIFAVLTALLLVLPSIARAQSLTTGAVSGTVTDPSGAAIQGATVTLKNNATGVTSTGTSNNTGAYRFSFLNPGTYTVTVNMQGFATSAPHAATVAVGSANTVNVQLAVAAATTTVEVTGVGSVLQTQNANLATTITPEIVSNIPNPGNDLTYYVQLAPGATMNTQAGYGNSALFGISGTSNYFTVDGMSENDPFLNLNNSGATNLLLGANDIQTTTVVNNGYSGEYGTLAGANVNYVTKSGTNKVHGNLQYFWNGSNMNANSWFNSNTATPKPFSNANQWAASVGGPIRKDKTFFFADTEGLRLLIPTALPVNIPSPQFQAATLAAIPASSVPFYNRIFSIYNNASGAPRATNTLPSGGCDGSVTLAGGAPCALVFQSSINNLTTEWLLAARVDNQFSANDHAFIHFRTDHGLQATYTDPLNPILNAQSVQPQYEGQIQWNHTLGANATNQFIVSGSWYSAIFKPKDIDQAIALMPYDLFFSGGQFYSPGSLPGSTEYSSWPQGRNVTQYQISDDFAWQKGHHNLKAGFDFRRNDVTDYTPGGFTNTIPLATFASQASFLAGSADTFQQAFATRPTQPLAVYNLGFYGQDEWSVRSNLKVTLALRLEHNSNPICVTNCFARLAGQFSEISHNPLQPYNQAIDSGLHQALPNYTGLGWAPRIGFAWQPMGNGKTVVRGGAGIFYDAFPASIASSFDTNSPEKNTFIVPGGASVTPLVPFAQGVPGNAASLASSSNRAFVTGFNSGFNIAQVIASLPSAVPFSPPTVVNAAHNIKYPTYYQWNLQVQRAIDTKMSFSVGFVGNHGSNLAMFNQAVNAFCNSAVTQTPFQPLLTPCTSVLGISSFAGLPTAPPDPRFTTVAEVSNPGTSNYNGLVLSFTRSISTAFQVQASYTWSHALDSISNGGFLPFNLDTNTSILSPQNPNNVKQYNYGNADYDARQQFNLGYSYEAPKLHGWRNAIGDWTVSGVLFYRTGLPFTAIDGANTGALGSYNYGPAIATAVGMSLFSNDSVGPLSCSSSNHFNFANPAAATPCMNPANFTSAIGPGGIGTFGAQRRNQIYGPNFFDTDLTIMKNFRVPHWESAQFQIGAQAFNILNHPNFDQPQQNIDSSTFGFSTATVASPTSIFGAFLGANAAPRALQIRAQLTF